MPRSFLPLGLARRRELGDGAARRRLGRLPAGVRVDLGVEDQDVHVAPGREHVVEPAEADVVGPAVATHDPHALGDERVGDGLEVARRPVRPARERRSRSSSTRRRCCAIRSSRAARAAFVEPGDEVLAELVLELVEQRRARGRLRVERQTHAEAELRVVLEQRVGPRGPAAVGPDRPRRRREVPAVDRRAAGRVRHDHPVAEQLREHLEVRRLAAAGAGARELEERPQLLRALHRVRPHARAIGVGDRQEEVEPAALVLEVLELRAPCRSTCASPAPCCGPGTRRRRSRSRCSRRARPGSSCACPAVRGTSTPCP